jgi:hypothetical protein
MQVRRFARIHMKSHEMANLLERIRKGTCRKSGGCDYQVATKFGRQSSSRQPQLNHRRSVMRRVLLGMVLLVAAALPHIPWLETLDHATLDAQFWFLRVHALRPATNQVVIVGIDDETTHALPEPFSLWHEHLGKFLLAAASAGGAAIGLDVVLPDRSFDAIAPGYDRRLLAGILAARRTVGNIGSAARHNYTAIGDTVNVASRLEQLTREVSYPLVCSVDVFEMLEDGGGFAKLGVRPIRGHRPVEIYGWRPDGHSASRAAEAI